MKNVINYYYQMNIENIHTSGGIYYFTYMNNSYMLTPFNREYYLLNDIYQLNQKIIKKYPRFYEIILTIEKTPFLFVDGKCFCLIKQSNIINDVMSFYDINFESIQIDKNIEKFIRFPWINYWTERIDYLENMMDHMESSIREFQPLFLYFLGLAENAVQYARSAYETGKFDERDRLVISHNRINSKNSVASLYFPLSLILDHPSRDIAEYLKSLFYNKEYDMNEIEEYLLTLNFSQTGYSMLFARILYPSFFFDLLDDVLNGKKDKKELYILNDRREEYRFFIREIYYIIRKNVFIEEVRWIMRK